MTDRCLVLRTRDSFNMAAVLAASTLMGCASPQDPAIYSREWAQSVLKHHPNDAVSKRIVEKGEPAIVLLFRDGRMCAGQPEPTPLCYATGLAWWDGEIMSGDSQTWTSGCVPPSQITQAMKSLDRTGFFEDRRNHAPFDSSHYLLIAGTPTRRHETAVWMSADETDSPGERPWSEDQRVRGWVVAVNLLFR